MMVDITLKNKPTFLEFFAGAGMARAGLCHAWDCIFSNDFNIKKGEIYNKNWPQSNLLIKDIKEIDPSSLPIADLAWASFPCQDLSLAGGGAGLQGNRSGTFYPFWSIIKNLIKEHNSPKFIVLENVIGTLTSHEGKDFQAICKSFYDINYKLGALVIDASMFVPQSRPRLFIIGVNKDYHIPSELIEQEDSLFYTKSLKLAYSKLDSEIKNNWIWWRLPMPEKRKINFSDILEDTPTGVSWHSVEETDKIISMMAPQNLKKLEQAQKFNKKIVGSIYKRTRQEALNEKYQRAEVRFDDVAGCLRTPAGGSSRQIIITVEGTSIKTRLISPRETARLMGLPDEYILPSKYNEAYHLTGDGVVVPVVKFISENILEKLYCKQKL